jgi:branched-subunit amino acid transport protein AzlD
MTHNTTFQLLALVAMMAVGTMTTRFLPFICFRGGRPVPRYVAYLGDVLPYAAVGMLVVYCLKDVSIADSPYGLPEAAALAGIWALHRVFKNTLLSIGAGTALYMILVQTVFS